MSLANRVHDCLMAWAETLELLAEDEAVIDAVASMEADWAQLIKEVVGFDKWGGCWAYDAPDTTPCVHPSCARRRRLIAKAEQEEGGG